MTKTALKIHGSTDGFEQILTPEALMFVEKLVRELNPTRVRLLARRAARQGELSNGKLPDFLPETEAIRQREWQVAPIPSDLLDRRVEITGPVERKMIINALNSGANVFMADFEDSNAPTWANVMTGQVNLKDAVRRTISFINPQGKVYELNDEVAVLFVRPRGLHLPEKHVTLDGEPVPAALFDFGLYFFHNARELVARGSGPYFHIPKLESHLEARLWNDVFNLAQDTLGLPRGTIRATVLIETILAAFEMDEILWELREHSAGLNCGRWDYIFSLIKKTQGRTDYTLPDRGQVTMLTHPPHSYSKLTIKTCHRRGIHAMGGMAAQIPIKSDPQANEAALADFQKQLGALGYKYQFVTLAGFHALNTSMFELAHAYRDEGMAAYAELQDRELELERVHGYRAVKHQRFVGAGYFDDVSGVISAGQSSVLAMAGSTEEAQFEQPTPAFVEAEAHHREGRPAPVAAPTRLVKEPPVRQKVGSLEHN